VNGKGRRLETQDTAEIIMKRKANEMANSEYGTGLGAYKRIKKDKSKSTQ